ncbi:MAG: mechanosensitive ion channel family protein [Bacteroidota bacterium]
MKDLINSEIIQEYLQQLVSWCVETLPKVLVMLLLFLVLIRFVKYLLRKFSRSILTRIEGEEDQVEKEKRAKTLNGIVHDVVIVTAWAIFLMILLKELGIDIAPILAGAGIVGLAVGFGAQELVRDAISGFFLLMENRIRTGDVAIINGTGGLVENINLRTITLRDLSGVVHTFQNGKIDTLANMTKEWSAMVFDIGVAYKENTEFVIEQIKEVGSKLQQEAEFSDKFLEPIEIFGLDKFGDSAIIIKARIKTKPSAQWAVGREFNKRLKVAFDEKGIEIPFPHRTIYWGENISPLNLSVDEKK